MPVLDSGDIWMFGDQVWQPQSVPRIMGILNVTPDSFSDGGHWTTVEAAVEQGLALQAQGADVLDVGGESTRPGAEPVSTDEELRRVIPVIERLAPQLAIPMSIDTMKSQVAGEALQAGARIVNDVTAGTFDQQMVEVCAASDCGIILMHMQGTPQTMQHQPHYENVVREVSDFLLNQIEMFCARGIDRRRIMVDPGIGFGKTADHNLELLHGIPSLKLLGRPVLIGHSRKRFLKRILGREVEERLAGTIGVAIGAAQLGAALIRVHDVQAVRDALTAWHVVTTGPSA